MAVACIALALLGATPRPSLHPARADVILRTFEVGATGLFRLDSDLGTVTIDVYDERTLRVEVERDPIRGYELEDFAVAFERRGNTVFVRGRLNDNDAERGREYRVRYRVHVPRAFDVNLTTARGDVTVGDLGGHLDVRSAAASLRLGRIGGRVTGRTSAGGIVLDGAGGDTWLETSAGSVSVDRVRGSLTVRTSAGSVTATRVDGDFDARTSAGNIEATLTRPPSRDARLETSAGHIELRVPPGSTLVVDADAAGGLVDVDLAGAHGRRAGAPRRETEHQRVGRGGPTLTLRTSGGTIRVRNRAVE